MSRSRAKTADQTLRLAWRASRPGLAVVLFFSACINVLRLALPLYLIEVLDRVPASRSVGTLVMLTVVALAAVLTGLALEAVRRRMLSRWGRWIERRLGAVLFRRGLGTATLGQTQVQDSLRDLSTLGSFTSVGLTAWIDGVWTPIFLFGAYVVHPIFGLMGLAAILLLIVLGVLQERTTRDARRAARQAGTDADDIVSTAERSFESVGALSMTSNLADRWQRMLTTRGNERERTESRLALFSFLKGSLRQVLYIGAVGVGIWLVLEDVLSLGSIFAARILLGISYRLAERPVGSWRSLRDAAASYASLRARLKVEDRRVVSVAHDARCAPLVVDNVFFRYSGQRESLLRNINVTLEPGEALVVTGAAATGKTTLSRLLVGLIEPRSGQVRLGDVEIVRLPAEMRAELIGYLPQHTELFVGSVRENIARMATGEFEAVVAAAKLFDMHETIIRLPEGYDTLLSSEALGLSGSERKRIALARAVYARPRVLVLDEPLANLDRPSRRTLENAIRVLKADGCSVVLTQAIDSSRIAAIAEKFMILGGGKPEYSVRQASSGERTKPGLRSVT